MYTRTLLLDEKKNMNKFADSSQTVTDFHLNVLNDLFWTGFIIFLYFLSRQESRDFLLYVRIKTIQRREILKI